MYSYGVNKQTIKCISAFLKDRKQRVIINDSFSFWASVISGVPQGSALGVILFIIFINYFVESCEHSDMFLYTDISKIFRHILSGDDHGRLQDDLG